MNSTHEFILGDCIEQMKLLPAHTVDVVITSPPYNLKVDYKSYNDNLKREKYLEWTDAWMTEVKRLMKPKASFFFNFAAACSDSWLPTEVACIAKKHFCLQNKFIWLKSVSIGDDSYGHFKPINHGNRLVNRLYEDVYHLTLDEHVELDRKAIGVPYIDKFNAKRWGNSEDLRCRGNVWFVPYKTVHSKLEKRHPASFPPGLVENCIKLHGLSRCKLVLDPFGGIGTVSRVCSSLDISSICIELDADYLEIGRKSVNN